MADGVEGLRQGDYSTFALGSMKTVLNVRFFFEYDFRIPMVHTNVIEGIFEKCSGWKIAERKLK